MGAFVLPLALAAACSAGHAGPPPVARAPTTIVVDGQTIDVAALREAVAGLCQARDEAATDPRAATTTFERRSRDGIDTTVRVLQRSNARLSSSMATAVEQVQAGLAAGVPNVSLQSDLDRLTVLMREGVARLGVPTRACAR